MSQAPSAFPPLPLPTGADWRVASRATLLACCLFTRHKQRGQAYARRLFLASLVYLPVFFACLILHQRRPPAELGVAATVEAEALEQVCPPPPPLPKPLTTLIKPLLRRR